MKRVIALFTAVFILFSLSACGSLGSNGNLLGSGNETNDTAAPVEPADDDDSYGGVGDGRIGDTIETYFFNFTINSGRVDTEYYGYTPAEGKQLLIVNLTVENMMNETIPMADTDFQAQWGEDGDDDYSVPITTDFDTWDFNEAGYVNEAEQLPYEYELKIGESRTGVLVYEVPLGYQDFSISTGDYFANGETGDYYFVYFTAK